MFTFLSVAKDRTACFYALLAERTAGAAIYLMNATEDPIGRHSVGLLLALIGQACHLERIKYHWASSHPSSARLKRSMRNAPPARMHLTTPLDPPSSL